jgi:F0F1-type ATP synthase assembly protein I
MKPWHLIIVVLLAFIAGALYPAPVILLRSKLGV